MSKVKKVIRLEVDEMEELVNDDERTIGLKNESYQLLLLFSFISFSIHKVKSKSMMKRMKQTMMMMVQSNIQ